MVDELGASIFSVSGRILTEMVEVKKDSEELKDTIKRLKKNYSINSLEKLHKKYGDKPVEFRNQLSAMVEKFLIDYALFRSEYANLLKFIVDALKSSEQEGYQELLSTEKFMSRLNQAIAVGKDRIYFPKQAQKRFEKEFSKAMRKLRDQLLNDDMRIKAAEKGEKKVGLLEYLISKSSAIKKSVKQGKKLTDEDRLIASIQAMLVEELRTGIRQDFLSILLKYVVEFEKMDQLISNLKTDIDIIVQDIEIEIRDIAVVIAPFMVAIQNEPGVTEKINKARAEFFLIQQQYYVEMRKIEQLIGSQLAIAQQLGKDELNLVAELSGLSQKNVAQAIKRAVYDEQIARH